MKTLIKQYLDGLERADTKALLALFSEDAMVYSPLYGALEARVFYPKLMADTTASEISLLDVFTNEENRTAVVNFLYTWTMANGATTVFDCVDVFAFDEQGKIRSVKIIYDTAPTRILFDALHP